MTTLESAIARGNNQVRAFFSSPMMQADLIDLANWTLIAISPGAAPLYLASISLPVDTYPIYADLTVSEMTNGLPYRLEVSTTMRDRWGNTIDPMFNTTDFAGIGSTPFVESVVGLSKNRVAVRFSKFMRDELSIRKIENYSFDNGLSVLAVMSVEGNEVVLATSDQTPGLLYSLTVGNGA